MLLRSFLSFSLFLLLSVSSFAQNKNWVVALKPDKNPEALLKERETLSAHLTKSLGKPVKVIVPLSGSVIQEGLINGTIDVAFISGLEMVKAQAQKAADVLLVTENKGKTNYQSYWVSLKEKPYDSVKDLKGKTVAFASRTSTSGYLVPVWDLVKQKQIKQRENPETFFGKGHVLFGTGYVTAIERVLSGDAEAAAVSDYVIDGDKHLTPEQKAKLKVVQSQGPVPTHIIAVRQSIPAEEKAQLRKAFLTLNEQPSLRDQVFTSKLVESDFKKHLSGLSEALTTTGISIE